MNTRHEHEKKQFRQLFRQEGVDELDRRFRVLEAFLKTEKHVTCQDIVDQLDREGAPEGLGFVAETMELLCRFGFASRMKFDDGLPLYEHRHLGFHHDHMVCIKCGKIIEFKDDLLEEQQLKLTAAYGFHMLQHKMEIYGICQECQEKGSRVIPLDRAKPGERVVITDLQGGKNVQVRLSSMGLRIGDTVEVVSAHGAGQLVIAAGESRFVTGKGLAEKIMVRRPDTLAPLSPGPDSGCPAGEGTGTRMLLSDMKQGQEGTVVRVAGESLLRRRILEMGINRGALVYVEKYAPLRDPVELVVKGYHVSLRVEEAAHICVENVRTAKSG
jgi:Fur family ferric uptake transcriptional regulator